MKLGWRSIVGLALVSITRSSDLEAQVTGRWEFIGIQIFEKQRCLNVNDPATSYMFTMLPADHPNYTAMRKVLADSLKKMHGYMYSTYAISLRPDRAKTVAVVRSAYTCERWNAPSTPLTSYRFYMGDSLGDIQKQVAEDDKKYKRTSVIEFINQMIREHLEDDMRESYRQNGYRYPKLINEVGGKRG